VPWISWSESHRFAASCIPARREGCTSSAPGGAKEGDHLRPAKEEDITIVMGRQMTDQSTEHQASINHIIYHRPHAHTNGVAQPHGNGPVENFRHVPGMMTTVHAITQDHF